MKSLGLDDFQSSWVVLKVFLGNWKPEATESISVGRLRKGVLKDRCVPQARPTRGARLCPRHRSLWFTGEAGVRRDVELGTLLTVCEMKGSTGSDTEPSRDKARFRKAVTRS